MSALYWYYKNTVLRSMRYRFVCIQCGYYHDFVCLWPASRLRYQHRHMWVRFIHTNKITVACMSSLILSIDLQGHWYFIMLYFKVTNGAMEKWWMVKSCNGEINISIGCFDSHKYWICLFVLFSNRTFLQQSKQFISFNIWQLTTSTATEYMLENLATTKIKDFNRGQLIVVR